jgi:hypothetical protein
LAVVDFGYIAASAEAGDHLELFDFLRRTERIYCGEAKKRVEELCNHLEHNNKINPTVRQSLYAELSILVSAYDEALLYLKKLA